MLTNRIGLDPAAVGSTLISRAVRIRMNELGLGDVDSYTSLISGSEIELQALIEEVVVPESWFFRDEAPFRHFQDHVRAGWVAKPARSPLRVLSIPCAGGEEPYSIVIALMEIGLDARRYLVNAIDVSTRRLEVARRGVFSSNAFRGSVLSFRDRYFRSHPEGFEIDPSLRARVRFLQGSILDPGLLSGEPVFDVLFCRNLLIYLDEPSRVRVMTVLDRLLAAEGLLIIGHADRLNLSAYRSGVHASRRSSSIHLPQDNGSIAVRTGRSPVGPDSELASSSTARAPAPQAADLAATAKPGKDHDFPGS